MSTTIPETIEVTMTAFGLSVLRKHRGRGYTKVSMTKEHVIVESPFYATHTYTYAPAELWAAAVATFEGDPYAELLWGKYTLTEVLPAANVPTDDGRELDAP